jgi:hypothetical protein
MRYGVCVIGSKVGGGVDIPVSWRIMRCEYLGKIPAPLHPLRIFCSVIAAKRAWT